MARPPRSCRPALSLVTAALVTATLAPARPLQEPTLEVHPPRIPAVVPATEDGEAAGFVHVGERLEPTTAFGSGVIESMEEVLERQRQAPYGPPHNQKARNGAQGWWGVPSRRSSEFPRSGEHYLFNAWGDTRMGIAFPGRVELAGAWFTGHGAEPLWTPGLRIIGFRDGVEVSRTGWLEGLSAEPSWLSADLLDVDRIEIEARPVFRGGGWYGLDDLTFRGHASAGEDAAGWKTLDFDDLGYHEKVSGSGYAGLTWEVGTGDFEQELEIVPPPQAPPGPEGHRGPGGRTEAPSGRGGTPPDLIQDFAGPRIHDAGAGWLPPDTCGSVGIDHFVAVVNQNLSVYVKGTGQRVVETSLQNFFNVGGSAGDPRVVFDPDSGRFVVIACDFGTTLYLAISVTGDPTGSWFKTSILLSQGADAGRWPDYPTLGVDPRGIYSASYMVGGGMSLFAIDKAPLIAPTPSLGTVTAFRNLPWEGAIQPCVTHGDPGVGYCVSRKTGSRLRLRYVQGPLTAPSLVEAGLVVVPNTSSPPDAPALGSIAPLDALDARPMNAVYRNGSVWTTHGVAVSGRAGCRWYEIDAASATTAQVGTVSDSTMHYLMPGIAVNSRNEAILGFSGSHAGQYAGAYLAGRKATDPVGELSEPVLLQRGNAAYNTAGAGGVNRWGDYSLSSVDPTDDTTFWTIQEHTRTTDQWGTWIGRAEYPCWTVTNYCITSPNSFGPGAVMTFAGEPSLAADDFQLVATGCPPNKWMLFYYGDGKGYGIPFGNGWRCVVDGGGGLYRFGVFKIDFAGVGWMKVDFDAPPAGGGGPGVWDPGDTWNCQGWFRDPAAGGANFNLTDGLEVTVCP